MPASTADPAGTARPPVREAPAAEFGRLGEAIVRHLFSAGLDLNYALMFFGEDSRGADRVRHATAEIDSAIISLRRLIVEASRAKATED